MKILSLSYLNIWPHGEGKGIPSIFLLQKGLVDKGWEAHFVCPAWHSKPGQSLYYGIHMHRFGMPFIESLQCDNARLDKFFSHIKASFFSNLAWLFFQIYGFLELRRIAGKLRPEIIYSHDLTAAFPAWLVSRIFKAKFVLRVYGTRSLWWQYQKFLARIKECRDFLALRLPADCLIITKDGTNADVLARRLGVKEEKIRHWRNGVDFSLYDPDPGIGEMVKRELGIPPGKKIILSTSRIIAFYRVDRLVFRLPEIFRLNPDCVCVIASGGQDKNRFEEFVAKNNISDKVFFSGMVDKPALKKLLNAADVFINLTSYSNCNNSLFEAMVAGKCIVALDNPNIRELIVHRESGYLLKEEELDDLPRIMRDILSDTDVMNRLKDGARNAALSKLWSWQARIDEEDKLLRGLV
ncbi:MAG TPA: hypothetical protein DCL35_05375 [Candidatus Omnitrophica bacterium]|nr:hypothetical protein [Candidatus Omnitrophota bacterium]